MQNYVYEVSFVLLYTFACVLNRVMAATAVRRLDATSNYREFRFRFVIHLVELACIAFDIDPTKYYNLIDMANLNNTHVNGNRRCDP